MFLKSEKRDVEVHSQANEFSDPPVVEKGAGVEGVDAKRVRKMSFSIDRWGACVAGSQFQVQLTLEAPAVQAASPVGSCVQPRDSHLSAQMAEMFGISGGRRTTAQRK